MTIFRIASQRLLSLAAGTQVEAMVVEVIGVLRLGVQMEVSHILVISLVDRKCRRWRTIRFKLSMRLNCTVSNLIDVAKKMTQILPKK